MTSTKQNRRALYVTTALVSAVCMSAPAVAQQTAAAADVEEIVVTGTLIRGIAPIGSNVVGISRTDIESSGVTDTNFLIGTLPQSADFMELPVAAGGVSQGQARFPVNRPTLRGLNTGTSSGQSTLVVLDGHRIVPVGIEGSQVDPGVIPSGILERVETILDGISAVYGSDAVGGVINYIPRKRFDRVEANVQYGFADNYTSISANATAGKTWDGGGIGFTYTFSKNDGLRGEDRDYFANRNYLENRRLTALACDGYGHATVGAGAAARRFVVTEGQTTFTERADWCQANAHDTRNPGITQHGGFMTFSQDLSDTIKLDVTAVYSWRNTVQFNGGVLGGDPFNRSATGITGTPGAATYNPYYRTITATGISSTAAQTVNFSYLSVLGEDFARNDVFLEMGQVTPTVTVDLGEWQVRTLFAYGKSKVTIRQQVLDATKEATRLRGATLTQATAINPYDVTATQNRALIGDLGYIDTREGWHDLLQFRSVADGPLFSIPGGEVRAAAGVEWTKIKFTRTLFDPTTKLRRAPEAADTSLKAVFGEVNIPLVGPSNNIPLINSLTVSASGRYDDYAVFGGTFNPKVGMNYEPVDWITLRGTWGTSFRAPNPPEKLGITNALIRCFGINPSGCENNNIVIPVGYTLPPVGNNVYVTLIGGTVPDVKPEEAENLSFGIEIRPPIIPNLSLSATWWKVDFDGQLGLPTGGLDLTSYLANWPQLYTLCFNRDGTYMNNGTGCAPQVLDAFFARASNGPALLATIRANGLNVLFVGDTLSRNIARSVRTGLDTSIRYAYPTSWGSINASANATFRLKSQQQATPTSVLAGNIDTGTSRVSLSMSLGATMGDFRAQATLQHRSGYVLNPSATRVPDQLTIDQYDVLNTSFRYNVNGRSPLFQNLALTLNINNVLDTTPPVNRTTNGGITNGNTIGRFIQFGISKEF